MSKEVPLIFHKPESEKPTPLASCWENSERLTKLASVVTDSVEDLMDLSDDSWDPNKEFRDVLRERSGKGAGDRLRSLAERIDMPKEILFRIFINHLKQAFVTSERSISAHVWNDLRKQTDFESAIVGYIRETLPEIFKNKYSQSLFDDIEFGLFLLGSEEEFDLLEDVRHSWSKSIGVLFNDRHSLISRDLSVMENLNETNRLRIAGSEEMERESVLCSRFERNIEAFEQLCELVNKIAAINSINVFNKSTALALAQMISAQVESVEHDLSDISYNYKTLEKLRFLKGKLLANYSHLEYFDGESSSEILRKSTKIVSEIREGLELMRESNFGWVPEKEAIATAVCAGNEAFIMLVALQKIEDLGELDEFHASRRSEWISSLFGLYGDSVKPARKFESAESVIKDFASRSNHDEFMIETVHHIVLFSKPDVEMLQILLDHLINEKHYHNVYHEEFKIKLFTVVLEKFEKLPPSPKLLALAHKIRDYSLKHEKLSGLVMSFSQLYLNLGIYLAGLKDDASKKMALECFVRFSRVAEDIKSVKFERHKNIFLERIGGKEEMERFEKIHALEKEKEIHERVLSMIARAARGETSEKIDQRICQIIEELFYGIASADIKRCFRWGKCMDCKKMNICAPDIDPKWVRRGNLPQTVPIDREHYMLLQYPANLEEVFQRIYEKREDFIQANLSSLLAIGMTNQELTGMNERLNEANRRLDYQVRTDLLTGRPNMRQFEEDSVRLEGEPEVFSMLIKIENLSEINDAYGIEVGNAFIKNMSENLFAEFFSSDDWRVYHLPPKEFAVVGTFPFSKSGITYETLVESFLGIASTFSFFPKNNQRLQIRAQLTLSYSDELRSDVYKKLHIALRHAEKNGQKTIRFDSELHSEKNAQGNLEWGVMVSEALRESRVVPYVQAIVDNFTGEVAKLECLARIRGKDGKILQPYQFIDHAKHSNLLPILTREMFKKACAELKETGLDFSINISWQDLADPELVTEIQKICEQHEINPSRVTVEILEEALASNAKEFEGKMASLKSLGCKIALDDFGAEGSNFSRFNRAWWPNVIKIDGQFIKGVDTDSDKRLILEAIVAAANKLGCELVAEFVDNEKVWRIVRDLGIRYTQWYFFHKPEAIPSEGFAKISADIRAIYDAVTTPEAETKSKVDALLSINGAA